MVFNQHIEGRRILYCTLVPSLMIYQGVRLRSHAFPGKACNQIESYFIPVGNIQAIYYLGMMYSSGTGIVRSCRTATEVQHYQYN